MNNDRSYEPPPFFTRNPLDPKEIYRTNYSGQIEYLNPRTVREFFENEKSKPKFSLVERRRNLIERQDYFVKALDEVFSFPFSIQFYYTFSGFLMNEMLQGNGRHKSYVIAQSKWFLTSLTALILKRYFGGKIVYTKANNLTVELESVKADVYIYNKIHKSKARDFEEWIYSLFIALWRYTNEGILFLHNETDIKNLDYVAKRPE